MKKARRKLTAVEIDASDEADVHPETAVAAGALEAHEGADGERPGRAALGRHDEGRPPRLALRAVRADLILRLGHEDLKALLELLLRRHFDLRPDGVRPAGYAISVGTVGWAGSSLRVRVRVVCWRL